MWLSALTLSFFTFTERATSATVLDPNISLDSGEELATIFKSSALQSYSCLTNQQACVPAILSTDEKPLHLPSLTDTLFWIGVQLKKHQFVHEFFFQKCQVAIDLMKGIPEYHVWMENSLGPRVMRSKSVLNNTFLKLISADQLYGQGHTSYFKNQRSVSSSESPLRLTYFNDAIVMNLSKIKEIKNYVRTKSNGELELYGLHSGPIKFVFHKGSRNRSYYMGVGFTETSENVRDQLTQFRVPLHFKHRLDEYTPIENKEPDDVFFLFHSNNNIEFNLALTSAFLHSIELCKSESGN